MMTKQERIFLGLSPSLIAAALLAVWNYPNSIVVVFASVVIGGIITEVYERLKLDGLAAVIAFIIGFMWLVYGFLFAVMVLAAFFAHEIAGVGFIFPTSERLSAVITTMVIAPASFICCLFFYVGVGEIRERKRRKAASIQAG